MFTLYPDELQLLDTENKTKQKKTYLKLASDWRKTDIHFKGKEKNQEKDFKKELGFLKQQL